MRVYFLLFIPVFVSTSPLSLVPLVLFFFPLIFFFSSLWGKKRSLPEGDEEYVSQEGHWERERAKVEGQERKVSYGGVVMIGPVPIVFGKGISEKALIALAVLLLLLMIIWLLLAR
ncbi:MAG: TIGR00304 family membrane protein [Thermoplasmata archaeon]